VWLSAVSGDGIELLREAITEKVSKQRTTGWLRITPSQGKLRALLFNASAVLEERSEDDGSLLLHIDITPDSPKLAASGRA